MSIITRFAPSPSGFLHLGHAYSAGLAQRRARAAGGRFLVRLEDIDTTRCRPEFAAAALEDLAWLGLHWDGDVRVQSAHLPEYRQALDRLTAGGLLYPCFCSRADIARAQTAPHGAEPVYPGTCRDLPEALRAARIADDAPYALRLDVARAIRQAGATRFCDEASGWVAAAPARLGDVILARRDIPTSYHLCVVHDDAAQGVTLVVRGEDLRDATHLHALLQRLLGLPTPLYAFHKLLTGADGKRLTKRDDAATLRSLRLAGRTPQSVLAELGLACQAAA